MRAGADDPRRAERLRGRWPISCRTIFGIHRRCGVPAMGGVIIGHEMGGRLGVRRCSSSATTGSSNSAAALTRGWHEGADGRDVVTNGCRQGGDRRDRAAGGKSWPKRRSSPAGGMPNSAYILPLIRVDVHLRSQRLPEELAKIRSQARSRARHEPALPSASTLPCRDHPQRARGPHPDPGGGA